MHIENRLIELLAEKRRKDKRRWSYRDVYEKTGITPATLSRFAQQKHNLYDGDILAKLCTFLECNVGDLLVVVEDTDPGQQAGV